MTSLIALAGAAVVLRLIWFLVRDYVVRSPLDNIPGPPSGSITSGNILQLISSDSWDYQQNLSETYGPVAKIHGFFGSRWLHVYDTKALHSIFLKDQESYYRGAQALSFFNLLLGPGLLGTFGETHKKQRKLLNPVFSTAHMRNMTPMFYKICNRLDQAIKARVKEGPKDLDIVGWMGRTALELVGQGGLGYSFDPLVEDTKDELADSVKAFVPTFAEIAFLRPLMPYAKYLGPVWFRRLLLDLVPIKRVQRVKEVNDTITIRCKEIFRAKKAAIETGDQEAIHSIGEGKDLMSILLRENMMAHEGDKLPEEELLAQMSTFLVAGVDTTSNALARTLHQLAMHQNVQEQLRAELLEARERYGQDIPYDELSQLPILDAVCRETLRLFSPITFVNRQAVQDTVLPLTEPIRGVDGTIITEIPVPKGTFIFPNVRACNKNKALWGEDAYEWKPERWLKPLPRTVEDARIPGIYANTMTFVSGSYSCIGFKFSQLEMKVVLMMLVASFKFDLTKTPIVWRFAPIAYPTVSKDSVKPEMYLNVSRA